MRPANQSTTTGAAIFYIKKLKPRALNNKLKILWLQKVREAMYV